MPLRGEEGSSHNDMNFGHTLTLSQTMLVFMCLYHKPFENTVGKGEIAHNEQFLLFPRCFLPVWMTFCHFHQIQNCHLQTLLVWKSLKFVVRERVKMKNILYSNLFYPEYTAESHFMLRLILHTW